MEIGELPRRAGRDLKPNPEQRPPFSAIHFLSDHSFREAFQTRRIRVQQYLGQREAGVDRGEIGGVRRDDCHG